MKDHERCRTAAVQREYFTLGIFFPVSLKYLLALKEIAHFPLNARWCEPREPSRREIINFPIESEIENISEGAESLKLELEPIGMSDPVLFSFVYLKK